MYTTDFTFVSDRSKALQAMCSARVAMAEVAWLRSLNLMCPSLAVKVNSALDWDSAKTGAKHEEPYSYWKCCEIVHFSFRVVSLGY
jgi:hypothetical protein